MAAVGRLIVMRQGTGAVERRPCNCEDRDLTRLATALGAARTQRASNKEVVVLRRISSHARGNAVAYIALFVALGGTAVASSLALPANSVGTPQLKNGAVTGGKVAKATLTGATIKAATLGTVPSSTTAGNAAKLGGHAPASFQARVGGTCTSGSAIASIAAARTVGCQSTNVTQMMGGIEQLPFNAGHYLAGNGLTPTPAPTTQTDGVGASAVPGTAGNLEVSIFGLEPLDTVFTVELNDTPTALTCTIPAQGDSCSDSTDTASIPAGAWVDISVSGGSGAATQVAFGWTDTTSG